MISGPKLMVDVMVTAPGSRVGNVGYFSEFYKVCFKTFFESFSSTNQPLEVWFSPESQACLPLSRYILGFLVFKHNDGLITILSKI